MAPCAWMGRLPAGQVRRPAYGKVPPKEPGVRLQSECFMHLAAALIAASVLCVQKPDTLDVARVTDSRNIAMESSAPLRRIQADELRSSGAIALQDALRTFAGVSVKDYGGIGGMKSVSIRSFGAQHTGFIYDGQVVSNAQNGQVDIGRFNLDDVQSVSVEIGGGSDIFRPARLASYAGVMTVESAKPSFDSTSAGTKASAQLRYGSFNTWNPYISVKQRIGSRWAATLWANYLNSRGNYPFVLQNGDMRTMETRLHSDVSSLNSEAALYGNLGRYGSISGRLGWYHSNRGLPGSVVLYAQNPHQRLWDEDVRANVLYQLQPHRLWKIKAGASYNYAWNRFVDYDPIHAEPQDDRYLQQEASVNAVALYFPLAGLDFSAAQDIVYNHLDTNLPSCPYPSRLSSYTALSAKYSAGGLTAIATLLATATREWAKVGEAAPGRWHLSPSASLSYKLPIIQDIRLRASFKDSYRLPTFNDLYYQRIGNRKLEPETAYQTNLGATWQGVWGGHSLELAADGYWNAVRNRIIAVPSLFAWSMRNVGRVQMFGCDIALSYNGRLTAWLQMAASANYSHQYAVDVTDPSAKNYRHQIAYTPRNCGSGSITLKTPWASLGYTLQAVGERYSLAQNTAAFRVLPYDDHNLCLSTEWTLGKKHPLKLWASAEMLNIRGENYQVIQYYPMPGRQYRMTIKITY